MKLTTKEFKHFIIVFQNVLLDFNNNKPLLDESVYNYIIYTPKKRNKRRKENNYFIDLDLISKELLFEDII